jgi:hypothetical protein
LFIFYKLLRLFWELATLIKKMGELRRKIEDELSANKEN